MARGQSAGAAQAAQTSSHGSEAAAVNGRDRPSRQSEERRERRRRPGQSLARHDRLALNGDKDPNYEYRWINDKPGRVHRMTQQDDWDLVKNDEFDRSEEEASSGTSMERVVDRSGTKAILVRKPKDYYEADQKAAQDEIDANEETIMRGHHGAKGIAVGANGYEVDGNTIGTKG